MKRGKREPNPKPKGNCRTCGGAGGKYQQIRNEQGKLELYWLRCPRCTGSGQA